MKSRFLLPHSWRTAGIIMFLVGFGFYIADQWLNVEIFTWHNLRPFDKQTLSGPSIDENFADEIKMLLILFGLLIIAFSKERTEDEYIAQQRLDSLQWAIYVNYAIFIVCVLAVYGADFIAVIIYNVYTPLLIFIIRFRWMMYRASKQQLEVA
jgi:hypothetical protein